MIIKTAILYGACLACLFAFLPRGFCQIPDEIKKQYSQDRAVVLNNKLSYNITISEGQPHIESDAIEEIAFLKQEASTFMSSYAFYQSDLQPVVSYEAFTRTANDKKLKVTEFKTQSSKEDFVFYDDSKSTSFDFPGIEEGATGYLHVSRIAKNPYMLNPFYFGRGIPVVNSELVIAFPKEMNIQYRLAGMDTSNISVQLKSGRKTNVYTFSYKNCPAIEKYDDAPGSSWFAAHVVFFIDSYKDAQGDTIRMLSNTDDLYKLSYGYLKNINTVIPGEIQHIVDSIIAKSNDAEFKARQIYSWVQHHIKYVAFEQGMEGFIPRDAGLVCNRRYGDCKDMSSILTVMMRAAGIPAYFTWIGTRDLAYSYSRFPVPLVSNHMICTIQLHGQYIFLDGTDPTCIYGFPSAMIQDKEALIAISEKEYKVVKVPIIDRNRNAMVDSTWLELLSPGIRGKIRKSLNGYYSMKFQGKMMFTKQSNLKTEIRNEFGRGSNKFQLDSFRIGDLSDPDKAELFGWFDLTDYARKLGDDWFINLNLFKFYTDEEIDYPKRKTPISSDFVGSRKYVTLIKIPDGYRTDYLPPSKSYHNSVWGFDITYEQKGNWVIFTQQFDDDHLMLENEQFEAWNKVLENLYPTYKESLSISKIATP